MNVLGYNRLAGHKLAHVARVVELPDGWIPAGRKSDLVAARLEPLCGRLPARDVVIRRDWPKPLDDLAARVLPAGRRACPACAKQAGREP